MPIYPYRCKQCGHVTDVLVKSCQQKISEVVCEKCSSKDTEKAIAGFSVGQVGPSANSCPTGTCGLP